MTKRISAILILLCVVSFESEAADIKIGTSFSPVQSEYLGMDWKKTYIEVLEAGFDIVRLGSYWNRIEKTEGVYDFSALDWQIKEAELRGIPIVLTVGMKAPRWPEYFLPEWLLKQVRLPARKDVSNNKRVRDLTLGFIEKVVIRYRDKPIITVWQVENETLNRIGEKLWYIGTDFLKEEVELVRKLDGGKRPILVTSATYPNKFLRVLARLFSCAKPIEQYIDIADIIGINVYPTIGYKFLEMGMHFKTNKKERIKYFTAVKNYIEENGKEVWVTELQAEPWEPGHLVYMNEKVPISGDPKETEQFFLELKNIGIKTIFLWGVEYWRFRKWKYKDKEWEKLFLEIKSYQ
ncbi:MAG: beta-galactosidase [Candidatus Omnitrophica bacterium]|nr:beta-galactosidase [Candidatus Omnitrophota bacterium]